jgi:hypothetical protein
MAKRITNPRPEKKGKAWVTPSPFGEIACVSQRDVQSLQVGDLVPIGNDWSRIVEIDSRYNSYVHAWVQTPSGRVIGADINAYDIYRVGGPNYIRDAFILKYREFEKAVREAAMKEDGVTQILRPLGL